MDSKLDTDDFVNEIKGKMIVHWNYRGLTRLPDAIRICASDIRELYLKENKLTNLPQWMTELVHVTHLYLHGNSLRSVPMELASMARLTLLDLSENGLESLPGCIGNLQSLEFLIVDHNFLKKLPPELQQLKNLQSLSICDNEFVALPEWLGSFEKLEQLRADNNSLEEMPNRLTLAPGLCVISVCSNRRNESWTLRNLVNLTSLSPLRRRLSYLPLNGFVSRPSIYFRSNPYLNYLSYPVYRQLLEAIGNRGIVLGQCRSRKSNLNTNLKICIFVEDDAIVNVELPRQLLKVHDDRVMTTASLWELALRKIYCYRHENTKRKDQDRVSLGVSYNLLFNGPIAVCADENCREAIFTEAWLIAATCQSESLDSDPVPIVALYCSQNCAVNFDCPSAGLDPVRWHLVHE